MDIVQGIYDVVNKHLGKDDGRGKIRVPAELEPLVNELQKYIVEWYNIGKTEGAKNEKDKLAELIKTHLGS